MNENSNILIIGAGAIGRGYVPWLFKGYNHKLTFADSNRETVEKLSKVKSFSSFMTGVDGYRELIIRNFEVKDINEIKKDLDSFDLIITAVGPRNFLKLDQLLRNISKPIWCFENDRTLVEKMNALTNQKNVFFGIPDVIASNESSEHGLDLDNELSLVTEDGPTFVERHPNQVKSHVKHVCEAEVSKQWSAKLFIHNTPHCVAAYLGSLANVNYIHEALQIPNVEKLVTNVATEMSKMIQGIYGVPEDFCNFYLNKEIKRFKNKMLFDTVSRVAREPLRKLELSGRLLGAAQMALKAQIIPENTLIGIHAAMQYDSQSDPDYHMHILYKSLEPSEFLTKVLGLDPQNILFELLLDRWSDHEEILDGLRP
jgi:mannitol-1-phosphate 5-dehydrogenase